MVPTWLAPARCIQVLPIRHPLRRLCLKRAPGHQRYEMKVEIIIAAILLVLCDGALAQTACPQGVAAGSAQCGPSSLVNPNDSGNRPEASPLPEVKWADSWGAIADDGHSIAGIVTGFPSKRKAKRGAIDECQKRGGEKCKVLRAFVNQCAAMIAGEGVSATASAPTKREAIRSEEHTSELQSLMRISYAVFCLKKKNKKRMTRDNHNKRKKTNKKNYQELVN